MKKNMKKVLAGLLIMGVVTLGLQVTNVKVQNSTPNFQNLAIDPPTPIAPPTPNV